MLKSATVVVPTLAGGNRDKGKVFVITEMPAEPAEDWALRAFLALSRSGVEIPANVKGLGMVGIAILGLNIFLQGQVRFEDLKPLMTELMDCVKVVRDPKHHPTVASPLIADDVEEVATRAWLKSEVINLHTGFSLADAMSKLISETMTPADLSTT